MTARYQDALSQLNETRFLREELDIASKEREDLRASVSSLEDAFGRARELWEQEKSFLSSQAKTETKDESDSGPDADVVPMKRTPDEKDQQIIALREEVEELRAQKSELGNSLSPSMKRDSSDVEVDGTFDRSVLNVYMGNQIELNESETAFYEEAVNKLAEQLENTNDELDATRTELEALKASALLLNSTASIDVSHIQEIGRMINSFKNSFEHQVETLIFKADSRGISIDARVDALKAEMQVLAEIAANKEVTFASEREDLTSRIDELQTETQSAYMRLEESVNEVSVLSSAMRLAKQKEETLESSMVSNRYSLADIYHIWNIWHFICSLFSPSSIPSLRRK